MLSFFFRLFGNRATAASSKAQPAGRIDYENAVLLDAEDLAEQGIAEAYRRILPKLEAFVSAAAQVEEIIDDELPSYSIRFGGVEHLVYSANEPDTERESWGRATHLLFHIVNEQLADSPVRFFAIGCGNDLCGVFLTPAEASDAQVHLPRRSDWPYIPNGVRPDYGQFN